MKPDRIYAVTRSFQAKATINTFDQAKFDQGVVAPIRKLLATRPNQLAGIVVVGCGDSASPAFEAVYNRGEPDKICTPTTAAIERAFPNEVRSGLVRTIVCDDWGQNFGSATALNAGIDLIKSLDASSVLCWSPEIDLDGHQLTEMIEHRRRYHLKLCGYARRGWTKRRQWTFVQNTIALWDIELFAQNGFDRTCNGDGKTVVNTPECGDVPVAGMEDWRKYLNESHNAGEFLPWGFIGQSHPVLWDLSLKLPGTTEYQKNEQKIARQTLVMDIYSRERYPDRHPLDVWDDVIERAVFA